MKVHVCHLLAGDILKGSGEVVIGWSIGAKTPRGKVDITLEKDGRIRNAIWGKWTEVNIYDRIEENV